MTLKCGPQGVPTVELYSKLKLDRESLLSIFFKMEDDDMIKEDELIKIKNKHYIPVALVKALIKYSYGDDTLINIVAFNLTIFFKKEIQHVHN
jgi:hypothetical protein